MNQQKIEEINQRLFYEMPLRKTDAALIAGCMSVSGSAARLTANFYKTGAFDKILITGGNRIILDVKMRGVIPTVKSGLAEGIGMAIHRGLTNELPRFFSQAAFNDFTSFQTEADYIYDQLIAAGVPDNAIIFIDDTAEHAQHHINNSREEILKNKFNSASLITFAPYQRRLLGTARKSVELNNVDLQTIPVYPYGINETNWHMWPISKYVMRELNLMNSQIPGNYVSRGFCVDPNIEDEIARMEKYPLLKHDG